MKTLFLLSMLFFVFQAQPQTQTQQSVPVAETPEALKQRLELAQRRLQDWAQLGRYRDANAQPSPPSSSEQRVVLYGD
jgi:hypothetical protein